MTALKGVIAATPTPVDAGLEIDTGRLVAHCRWLLADGGCDGVNLLGTTGEATSFSLAQRIAAMTAVAGSGLPLDRMMVGTGASALADAVELTRAASDLGFAGALLLPPFYYPAIDADSLTATVETVLDRVDAPGLKIYLYHIPQNTGVPFPVEVVKRLHDRHPDRIAGLKDSAGDIEFSRRLAAACPGLAVFPSSEGSLVEGRLSGFAGCISATTNVTGRLAQIAWSEPGTEAGRAAGAAAMAIRTALGRFPLMAGIKAALADRTGDPEWERLVPPLRRLSPDERRDVFALLDGTEYRTLHASSGRDDRG